jgi:hypothetical protein
MEREEDTTPEVTAKAIRRILDDKGSAMDVETRSKMEIKALSAEGRLKAGQTQHRHQSR